MNDESLGIVSLVCGLVSIFLFPLAFGGTAIIVGYLVMGRNESDTRAYGNARIGMIAGIVGIVLWVATLASMGMMGIDVNSLFGSAFDGGTPADAPAF